MRLILVRHGETCWNKERRVQGGDSDIELNETGLEQANRLASFLQNENIVAVHASPMRRAMATAGPIASRHGLPVEVDRRLIEIRVGELEGTSVLHLNTTFSQFLMERWRDRTIGSTDGETVEILLGRVWPVIEGLLDRHDACDGHSGDHSVVVVSHFFVTLAILLKALDLPIDSFPRFKVDLGSVSTLEFSDHGTRLLTFNDVSY